MTLNCDDVTSVLTWELNRYRRQDGRHTLNLFIYEDSVRDPQTLISRKAEDVSFLHVLLVWGVKLSHLLNEAEGMGGLPPNPLPSRTMSLVPFLLAT